MMLRPLPVRNQVPSRHHLLSVVIALGAALTVLIAAAPAEAARGRRAKASGGGGGGGAVKVGVLNFTGPGEAASRAAASQALSSKKISVVPGAELSATAKQLHVRLDDDNGFKAVAKQLNLTAFVAGEVSKTKATLTVRTGSDGSVVGEESFAGADPKKVAATISKTFWKRLAGAFNKTNPPSGGGGGAISEEPASSSSPSAEAEPSPSSSSRSEEPTPAAEPEAKPRRKVAESEGGSDEGSSRPKAKPAKAAESSESGETPGDHPSVDVAVGVGDMLRSLAYNQLRNDLADDAHKLAKYSLPSGPILAGKVDLFPFALMGSDDFLADIGLAIDFSYLLPVVTSPGMGGSYKTASLAWAVGPKVRLPMGLFLTAAYGDRWYKLVKSNSNMAAAPVPTTDYKFVRIGGGIRHMVNDSLNLGANIAYDYCLGKPGQIASADFFPKTTCAGLELGAMVGYRIAESIELRTGVDVQRFGLAFHNTKADINNSRPIAGGALDQYVNIYVNLAYVMGAGSSSGGGDAEKAPSGKSDSDDKSDDGDDDGDDDDDSK